MAKKLLSVTGAAMGALLAVGCTGNPTEPPPPDANVVGNPPDAAPVDAATDGPPLRDCGIIEDAPTDAAPSVLPPLPC